MSFLHSAFILGVLSVSTISFAGEGFGPRFMRHGMHGGQQGSCLMQLNLTAEQREQIGAIHKEFDSLKEKAATEMRTLRLQRRDLNIAKAGEDKIKEVEAKIVTARTAHMKVRYDERAKVEAILTPEQRTSCHMYNKR